MRKGLRKWTVGCSQKELVRTPALRLPASIPPHHRPPPDQRSVATTLFSNPFFLQPSLPAVLLPPSLSPLLLSSYFPIARSGSNQEHHKHNTPTLPPSTPPPPSSLPSLHDSGSMLFNRSDGKRMRASTGSSNAPSRACKVTNFCGAPSPSFSFTISEDFSILLACLFEVRCGVAAGEVCARGVCVCMCLRGDGEHEKGGGG